MPIYEYECRACGNSFECLMRGSDLAACPACQSADLHRLPSSVAVTSAGKLKASVAAGRRKLAQTTWREQRIEREEATRHHDE